MSEDSIPSNSTLKKSFYLILYPFLFIFFSPSSYSSIPYHESLRSALFLDFNYMLMNLLYSIIFSPPSTFCALNFFENRSSPSTLLIEENTISAIHLLPAVFDLFPSLIPKFLD